MKPELNLTAQHAWIDPAAARLAAPGRNFWSGLLGMVIVACLALALAGGQFRPRGFGPYSVSVPLDFRPYDPARWAVMNAGSYRSEEHTSELQSLMRLSYAVFCLKT